jgi:site-specific DNA-methyltransferase (adenine-specific)
MPPPHFELLHGDCRELLSKLDDNSIDALIADSPSGASILGITWDSDRGGRDQWIGWLTEILVECRRVLKPGAHVLLWSLPRTSSWTCRALEDAGFEVRDMISHVFNTGLPKTLDVAKAAIPRRSGTWFNR